jgi:hypothetical protein
LQSSHHQAFDKIKRVIRIKVICYASDHQLGTVIIQERKPIVFDSRKINIDQKQYTSTERDRELLSVIEIQKETKNILLGFHRHITAFALC